MNVVRLGIDLGELEHEPEALYRAAHLAHIACGGHAGDEGSIARAVLRCAELDVQIGAHPGYPDRARFGRVELDLSPAAIRECVYAQCARVRASAARHGRAVETMKLHGALYHRADRDRAVADAALEGAAAALGGTLTVVALSDRETARAARAHGFKLLREGFADRAVREDRSLVPRGEPGAVLHDEGAVRARVEALLREDACDVLCVHGDHPSSAQIALSVRAMLDARAGRRG